MSADEPICILAEDDADFTRLALTVEALRRTGQRRFILCGHPSPVVDTLFAEGTETTVLAPAPTPLIALAEALRHVPSAQRFAFVASGVLVTLPLREAFAQASPRPFGLAAPIRRVGRMDSYHPRVLLGQGSQAVQHEVMAWLRETATISPATATLYGSAAAAAFTRQAAKSHEGGGTIIAKLPEAWWRGPLAIDTTDPQSYVPEWLVKDLDVGWQARKQSAPA
jgi:hypothetical protein